MTLFFALAILAALSRLARGVTDPDKRVSPARELYERRLRDQDRR